MEVPFVKTISHWTICRGTLDHDACILSVLIVNLEAEPPTDWKLVHIRDANDSKDAQYQLSKDADFDFEIVRNLSYTAGEGSDVGEVLVAAQEIIPKDMRSYSTAFNRSADRVQTQVDSINATKYPVSARKAYFRASSYYRLANFFLHGNCQRFNLTSNDNKFEIPAIFYSSGRPGPRPTIILCQGYDGAQEEMYHVIGKAALERGINVITYEGPGQPTVRREQAPRAAAFDHRLAAVMAVDGVFDFGQDLLSALPPVLAKLFTSGNATGFNHAIAEALESPEATTEFRWTFQQGEAPTPYDFLNKSQAYNLETVINNIKVPVFVGDAEDDHFFKGQAQELAKALGSLAHYHFFNATLCVGEHCSAGGSVLMNQVVLDWFEGILANVTRIE
ncbi:putative alpha/beta hydrolase [Dactylonectria macrodidyma]|uniref:Alpha/beta hydrolase n=1 Tax=Dactylonectria macrodidyma TaxID=307937 RepID=A0A9P9ENP1_9HYPO|nr:putative alpha/beta hydrolase [Dactylonectria macrodidyma]